MILIFVDWRPMICICAWNCQDSAMIQHPSRLELHCAICFKTALVLLGVKQQCMLLLWWAPSRGFNGVHCAMKYIEGTPNGWAELCIILKAHQIVEWIYASVSAGFWVLGASTISCLQGLFHFLPTSSDKTFALAERADIGGGEGQRLQRFNCSHLWDWSLLECKT